MMSKNSLSALGLAAMMIMLFSGLALGESCRGLPGELFFNVDRVIAPAGVLNTVAEGISKYGETAMLTFQFNNGKQSGAQLVKRSEDGSMQIMGNYGRDDYFSPSVISGDGAIVGYRKMNYGSSPSIITVQRTEILLSTNGWIIGVTTDSAGMIYVLVNRSDDLVLFTIPVSGVVSETTLVRESDYSSFGSGGLFVDQENDSLYLVVPMSVSFDGNGYNSLSVYELELKSLTQKNAPYVLGWNSPWNDLPSVYSGGINGARLMGWFDGSPFVYDLRTPAIPPKIISVCPSEHAMAQGIFLGNWIVGGVGSASLFFQDLANNQMRPIIGEFQFTTMGVLGVNEGRILVQVDYEDFYILSLKE